MWPGVCQLAVVVAGQQQLGSERRLSSGGGGGGKLKTLQRPWLQGTFFSNLPWAHIASSMLPAR